MHRQCVYIYMDCRLWLGIISHDKKMKIILERDIKECEVHAHKYTKADTPNNEEKQSGLQITEFGPKFWKKKSI